MGTAIKLQDKVVGILRTDRVFITFRKSTHYFRKFHGFGLSYDVIKRLRDNNCQRVVILWKKENGETERLETTPHRFLEDGIVFRDGDYDNQRILSLDILRTGTLMQQTLE